VERRCAPQPLDIYNRFQTLTIRQQFLDVREAILFNSEPRLLYNDDMLSDQVRAAESDIDEKIRELPIWRSEKNLVLKGLVDFWRDGLEVAYMRFGHANLFQNSESFKAATAMEHEVNTGVFWCLKWTFEYASGNAAEPTAEQLVDAVIEGRRPLSATRRFPQVCYGRGKRA
jgi:hypothetical protein